MSRPALILHCIDPQRRAFRFYLLHVDRDLFGRVVLVRTWGRIGSPGVERRDEHEDEASALAALERIAGAKRRRGYKDEAG